MEPKQHTKRQVPGTTSRDVMDISNTYLGGGDDFLEDNEGFLDTMESESEAQKLRIEGLKKAIDIAKLMSNVTTDDIINIAKIVIKFIKETEI